MWVLRDLWHVAKWIYKIFASLNQYIEIPRGAEKYSRLRKEAIQGEEWIIFNSSFQCMYLGPPVTSQTERTSK